MIEINKLSVAQYNVIEINNFLLLNSIW
jgi:hypothetical protein